MRADEVLLAQFDFCQRLRDHRFQHAVTGSFASEIVRSTSIQRERDRDAIAKTLADGLEQHVRLAECFRVTEDMCDLVKFAADSLDETDQCDHTLAPAPWGWVRFEKGLPIVDIRGKTMLIHFMSWGPAEHGEHHATFVTMWNDPKTEPDDVWKALEAHRTSEEITGIQQIIGRWAFVGADVMDDGMRLGPSVVHMTDETRQRADDEGERETLIAAGFDPGPILEAGSFTNSTRYVHALWLLLGQTITMTEEEFVRSSTRKRIGKMKLPPKVTVIMLRKRASNPAHGETHVEWQHKWIVRGHWAWRVCSDKHPLAQTAPVKGGIGARVWINPYWKGPEDAPLMQTDKIYQLSR